MRVTNSMMVNDLKRNLNTNMEHLNNLQEQMSTGRKINKLSDDPAGLVKSLRLRTNITEGQQYQTNISGATSFMETTDAALQSINDIMQRVRELTVKAATGTNDTSANQAISEEISQLEEQLQMVANSTYGSKYIFGGTNVTEAPYQDGVWTGNDKALQLEIGQGVTLPINIPEMKEFFTGKLNDLQKKYDKDTQNGITSVTANDLQEGEYIVNTTQEAAVVPSDAMEAQSYLTSTGSKGKFFYDTSGQAVDLGVGTGAGDTSLPYSGSLLVEVKSVDAENGKVVATIKGHVYENTANPDGTPKYNYIDLDNVELNMQATAAGGSIFTLDKAKTGLTNDIVVWNQGTSDLGGIDHGDPTDATKIANPEIKAGDKTVISFSATGAQKVDVNYNYTDVNGEGRGSHSFTFSNGYFNNKTQELKFFTLNQQTGISYDGSISLGVANFVTQDKAASFSYQAGLFNYMKDLGKKVAIGKLPEVGNELAGNDSRLQDLLTKRATIGAKVNRLELQQNRLSSTESQLTALLSTTEDVNEAEVIMNMKMEENVYQASLAAGARIIQPTLVDFLS
ncbi:MAG: flagellar hook-associated protein FlgL [Syntrophomonas sp.]